MRTFHLVRKVDVSGVSGTGIVADGVIFPDGTSVIKWRGKLSSMGTYPDIDTLIAIHGHEGNTLVEYIDAV